MPLARRDLLLTAAAAGLMGAAPKSRPHPHAAHLAAGPAGAAPGSADAALNSYFDQLSEEWLQKSPETATFLGLDKGMRAGLKSQLSNSSWSAVEGDRAFCRTHLARLASFADAGLSPKARLNRDVVAYALQLGADAAPFDYGDNTVSSAMGESSTPYVVSQQGGSYSGVPEFLDSQHQVANEDDADAYLERLHAFGRVLSQETDRIQRDAGQGVIAPDFILDNTIGQQQDLLAVPAAQARLVTALQRKVKDAHIAGDYSERAARLVSTEVYPALARQLETLKSLRPKATHDAGVWRLPKGEAYYAWLLRVGTSTNLTAQQIHQMGLEQNRAIEARMDGLLKAQGMTQGTVGERMTALGNDPKHLFANTDAGRAQLLTRNCHGPRDNCGSRRRCRSSACRSTSRTARARAI